MSGTDRRYRGILLGGNGELIPDSKVCGGETGVATSLDGRRAYSCGGECLGREGSVRPILSCRATKGLRASSLRLAQLRPFRRWDTGTATKVSTTQVSF